MNHNKIALNMDFVAEMGYKWRLTLVLLVHIKYFS